ncbi:Glycoside hydrolase [Mycena indigotica]|uniref:Glycoside hydrolase n=1 Tax=Mycena indigotica TaxID=2126181 RepID=A0A8H6T1Z8_9AGAR|nr:Glycoside hydrolase [Mycena indigotica]KAF7309439.1 Glycoside hydrolase [Mycena indigotica]
MPATATVALAYGPILVGGCVAFLLSGIVAVQCIIFFKLYPDESRLKTGLVAGVWTLDVAQTVFIIASFIDYFIVHFGDMAFCQIIPWSIALTILLTALQTCVVHLFYAAKIYRSSAGNWFITAPIVLFAFLRVGAAVAATAEMLRIRRWVAFEHGIPHFLFTAGLTLSAATDAIITLCLCYYLRQIRRISTSSVMDSVLNKLTLYTLENGFVTFLTTMATLLLWLFLDNTGIPLALHFVLGKLYPNSLLVLLNTRKSLREMHAGDPGIAIQPHTDSTHHLAAYYALFPHRAPLTSHHDHVVTTPMSSFPYGYRPPIKMHRQAPVVEVRVQKTVETTTRDLRRHRRHSDSLSTRSDSPDVIDIQPTRLPPSVVRPDARYVFPASFTTPPASEPAGLLTSDLFTTITLAAIWQRIHCLVAANTHGALEYEPVLIKVKLRGGFPQPTIVMRPVFGVIGLLFCLLTSCVCATRLDRRDTPSWTGPLSTRGRYVVDANRNRFKLRGGNWHGASGTYEGSGDINDDANHHSGENAHTMPLGLQYVPIDKIIDSFVELGINTIRLQFSNAMIHDNTIVNDDWVAANPQFKGMTCLQVYDAVITTLTARGIAVIINNHTNTSIWCCGVDGNERWDESQSFATYAADWVFMVNRYKSNKRVVGADLYNEVRRDITTDPNWGSGGDADWQQASQRVSDQILTANPDILIIVEGINWVGLPVDGFSHGRPTLIPVAQLSHTTLVPHKLVYSAHFYSYTGPNHSGATGIGETSDPRYRDLSRNDLFSVLQSSALYVALTASMHYTAPVWISEFGMEGRADSLDLDHAFWQNFVDYLVQTDVDYAFWPLVGYLDASTGAGNGWALMNWEKLAGGGKRIGLFDGDDWRASGWQELTNGASATGQIASVSEWKQLSLDHGDFIQSQFARANLGDWDNGASKAQCPDNLRLIGLSRGSSRGLCTDVGFGSLWNADHASEVVFDERHVTNDWASGYTKYTCPSNYFVSGWAIRGSKVSTVMCAHANKTLGTNGRTVWFDQGDNRADQLGGDFAVQQFKGSCGTNEYIGGVAFTTRIGSNGAPASIYCVS